MKNIIPNALTALNLVLGMLSIIFTLNHEFLYASLFIVAAMIADGSDGRVARYFQVSSDFGKELDSLCDLISFGAAPAILAYAFSLKDYAIWGALIAVFFTTCGALRLARFNVNTDLVKGYFMGLPIPAAGCVVATFVVLGIKPVGVLFPLMVVIYGYLMVSTIRYPDFKGKGEKLRIIPGLIAILAGLYIFIIAHNLLAVLFAGFFAYSLFGILNSFAGLFDTETRSDFIK